MSKERFIELFNAVKARGATEAELKSLIDSFKENTDISEGEFKQTAILPILQRINRDGAVSSASKGPSYDPRHEEEALEARKIMGRPRATVTPTGSASGPGSSSVPKVPSGGTTASKPAEETATAKAPTLDERKAAMKRQVDDLAARCGEVWVPAQLTMDLKSFLDFVPQFYGFSEAGFARYYNKFETNFSDIETQLTAARNAHELAVDGAETARLATVENFKKAAAAVKAVVPPPTALIDKLKSTLERLNATKAMDDPAKKRGACVAEDKVLAEITRDANDVKAARAEAATQMAAITAAESKIRSDLPEPASLYATEFAAVRDGLTAQVEATDPVAIRAAIRTAAAEVARLDRDAVALKAARGEAAKQSAAIPAAESKVRADLTQIPDSYAAQFKALRDDLALQATAVDAAAARAAASNASVKLAQLQRDATALKAARGEATAQLAALVTAESKVRSDLPETPAFYVAQIVAVRTDLTQQATEVDATAIREAARSARETMSGLQTSTAALKKARKDLADARALLPTPVPKGLAESAAALESVLEPAADATLAVFDAEVRSVGEEIKLLKTAPGLITAARSSVEASLVSMSFSMPMDPFLSTIKAEITDKLALAIRAELGELKAKLDEVKRTATDTDSALTKSWNLFIGDYNKYLGKRKDVQDKKGLPDKLRECDKIIATTTEALKASGPAEAHKLITPALAEVEAVLKTDWAKVTKVAKDKINGVKEDDDLRRMPTQDKLDLLRDLRRTNELAGSLSPAQKTLQKRLYRTMGSKEDNLEPAFEAHEKDKRKEVLTEVKKVLTESRELVATIKDWDAYPPDQTEDKRRAAMKKVRDWSNWENDPNLDAKVKADLQKKMAVAKQVLKAQCAKMGIDPPPEIVFDTPSGPEPVKGEPNRTTTSKGSFNPGTGKIHLNPDPKGAFNEFPDAIDTIIHENTHNYQKKLTDELEAGTLTKEDPRYVQALVFQMNGEAQGYIDSGDKHEDYKGQPVEAHAWKAGGEASKLGQEILKEIGKT